MRISRTLPLVLAIAMMLSAAVLSNYGGGAQPVSQKIQNLIGRK